MVGAVVMVVSGAPARAAHLTTRFVGSLWPGGPRRSDEAWVASILDTGELELWRRLSGPDRRHGVGVARTVRALLPGDEAVGRPVVAAALLHDIGKLDARLGTFGRVVATLAGEMTRGRRAARWSQRRGLKRRIGLYLRHASLGADRLALAGSDPLTVAWAREHHLPPEEWTVPLGVGHALKVADND